MGEEFKIKTSLDLDTGNAKKKMSELSKEKIKAKLDLDTNSFNKSVQDYRKSHANASKDISKMSSGVFKDTMDKELNAYRKLLNNKKNLERAYLREQDSDRRDAIEKQIEASKKTIQEQYGKIMDSAISNKDVRKAQALNALTTNALGKNPFGGGRPARELLADMEKIEKISRETRGIFQKITGESSKKMIDENQKKNESILKRVRDAGIHDDNAEIYNRRAQALNQLAKQSLEVDKQEQAFNEHMRKSRINAGKIENEELKKQTLARLDEIQAKKDNIYLKGHPNDVSSSFKGVNQELKDYAGGISQISTAGRKIETAHNKELSSITKKGENIKESIKTFNNDISKNLAKNMNLDNQVDNILKKSKSETHKAGALNEHTKKMDAYHQQAKEIEKVEQLGNRVNENINRSKSLLGSYLDGNVNKKAEKIVGSIENMYGEIDRKSPEKALHGLKQVDGQLKDISTTAKHLDIMDKMALKINSSKNLDQSNKRQLLNNLYQKGFQNVGKASFKPQMRVMAEEMKTFDVIGRQNVASQKRYERELNNTVRKAGELKNTLKETGGVLSEKYRGQLKNDIDSFVSSAHKNGASKDSLISGQNNLKGFRERKSQLSELATLEDRINTKYESAQYKLQTLSNYSSQKRANEIGSSLRTMYQNLDGGSMGKTSSNLRGFNKELEKTSLISKQLVKHDNSINRLSAFESSLKPKEINRFRKELHALGQSSDLGTPQFESKLKGINTQMTALSRYRSTVGRLKDDFKSSFMGTSVGMLAGEQLRTLVHGAFESYRGLDDSMIAIKKVAQDKDVQTVSQIKGITKDAISVAKEVGASSTEVQYAIASSLQAGMGSMKNSMAVARKSMILANIGDMNKEDATKSISTIVKSFNLDPLKKQRIQVRGLTKETTELNNALDLVNHAGNNFAISESGVVEALQQGGGVLHSYGVSLADSIALVTTANEPLQDPKKVGNGLKSIAINFAGMSASAKDGSIKLNKTAMALQGIAGIDIYANKKTGQIKSMMQLIDELRPKWKNLRDDQRMALSEAIAGKHRANVFQALMQNGDTLDKIRSQFNNGEHFGSAEQENQRFVNSIGGKANRLKETMTSIIATLVNNKGVYGFFDALNTGASGLERLVQFADKHNAQLPLMISGLIGLKSAYKNFSEQIIDYEDLDGVQPKSNKGFLGGLFSNKDKKKTDKKSSGSLSDGGVSEKGIQEKVSALDSENKKIEESIENKKEYNKESEKTHDHKKREKADLEDSTSHRKKDNESVKEASENHKKLGKAVDENTKKIKSQNKETPSGNFSTDLLSKGENRAKGFASKVGNVAKGLASGLLSSALSMGTSALLMYGTTKLIEGAYGWYQKKANGIQLNKEEHLRSRDALKQENKAIQSNIDYVKQNANAIDSLYRRKKAILDTPESKRSDEQVKELENIKAMENRLAKISPSSVVGYDKNGDPIIKATANAKEYLKTLELIKKQKEQALDKANSNVYEDNTRKTNYGDDIGESGLDKINRVRENINRRMEVSKAQQFKFGLNKTPHHGMQDEFGTYMDKYNDMLDKLVDTKNIEKASKKFRNSMGEWRKGVDSDFKALRDSLKEYDNLNMENTGIQLENISKNSRFKSLSNEHQDATMGLASLFQWGKIENPKYATDALLNLSEKVSPSKLASITKEINDLNQAYQLDRDYNAYSKGIDNVVESLGKLSGMSGKGDLNKLKSYLKDVDRGFDSLDDMWESKYMRNHGTKKSDLLKDNADGIYAQKIQSQYNAIKEAHDTFANAKTFDERKNALEMFSQNTDIAKGQRGFAQAMLDSGKLTNDNIGTFEKLSRALLNVDTSSASAKKNLQEIGDAFDQGNLDKASDLAEKLGLSMEDFRKLFEMGLKGDDFKHLTDDVSKQLYENVQNFYDEFKNSKGEKIEVPIDVQAKIAENGLTQNDIKGMEKVIEAWGMKGEVGNSFRSKASKFFEGTGGDTQKAFQNMAKTTEGMRTAIDFGIEKQLAPYSDKIMNLAKGFNQLTDAMKGSARAMSDTDYTKYIDQFNSLSDSLKNVAKSHNISNAKELGDLQGASNTIMDAGFNEKTATKTVDLIINTVGSDHLGDIKATLDGMPDELKTQIIAEFNTENGGDAIHGLQNLFNESGGDMAVMKAVIDTHLANKEGLDFLEKYSKTDASEDVKDIKVKMTADDSDVKNKKNKAKEPTKSEHNVQGNTSDAEGKKNKLKQNSKSEHNVQGNTSNAEGKKKSLEKNTKSTHSINIKMPKPKIDFASLLGKIKSPVLKVTDNASGPAKAAKEAVNSFPKDEKKATVSATDNASGPAKTATGAVNAFPQITKTSTLRTVYETIYNTIGSPSGGGGGGGKKGGKKTHSSISIDEDTALYRETRLDALKNHKLPRLEMSMVKPRHTQMNPLAGTPVGGGASLNAGAGASTSGVATVGGGVAPATQEPIYTMKNLRLAIDNFRNLKSDLSYKWLTIIHRAKIEAKEMGDALKYNVDILKTADFAVKRIDNSVKALNTRIRRATGSKKASLLYLQNDELREKKRRLDTMYKQSEDAKLYYRSKVQPLGLKFSPGNEIPTNLLEISVKLQKKAEELDKKMSKEKKEKNKKKLEEEKKKNDLNIKMLEEYEKYSLKQQEVHSDRLETLAQIEDNEDTIRKDKITAFKEYYDNVQKVIDIATRAISRDLDIISIKTKNAFGADKLKLFDMQIDKYNEMKSQLESSKDTYKHTAESIKNNLIRDYGIRFKGDKIIDFEGQLAKLRETSTMYNEVKQMASDYLDLMETKIPDIDKQMEEFNEKNKDSMRSRLELTKNIEDKITSLYKKQLDEQVKGLEKVQKLRDEDLKKRKEAYQLARKEADFQDDLNKKKEELKELELKRDILSKDFSQRGQKDKQKVEKEIKAKSEEITKLTNRYFDDLIIRGFDEESKKGSDRIKDEREKIEEKYTDTELLKLAQESLQSGVLIGINGEKNQNLQEALINYLNRYEGGLGATGSIIKGEALANLNIATDTVGKFSDVISKLGSDSFNVGGYIQESQYREVEADRKKYSNEINYNSPLVSIQGVKADDIAKEIYPFIRTIMDEQLKALAGNVR